MIDLFRGPAFVRQIMEKIVKIFEHYLILESIVKVLR